VKGLAELKRRIQNELEPKLDREPHDDGGYNCCGCTTPAAVLEDVLAIIDEEEAKAETKMKPTLPPSHPRGEHVARLLAARDAQIETIKRAAEQLQSDQFVALVGLSDPDLPAALAAWLECFVEFEDGFTHPDSEFYAAENVARALLGLSPK
jgi:hypothetical protein